jgi:two-component system response regulator DegU
MSSDHAGSKSFTRILLVDDFQPWREWVHANLAVDRRFRIVGEAKNGPEALERARKLKPDLVLLDIELPELNGIEVSKQLMELAPNAKILVVTQHDNSELLSAALSNGAHGYLLKMDSPRELIPAIEAVLRGEKFVSSQLNH